MNEPEPPTARAPQASAPQAAGDDQRRRQDDAARVAFHQPGLFAPGALVLDRFRILRLIARGGAGEVYEASDTELRCPVALKVVRPELAQNEATAERFRREIALARQVTHPNVCRIFDVFKLEVEAKPGVPAHSTLFLTMELLIGDSLAERLRKHGRMTTAEALPLIADMVAGLTAAHRAGVLHRDFKSANVVLAEEGERRRAVVTDFGRAQAADPDDPAPLTLSGTVVGTPNYMAPEQIVGDVLTPAVDQYALGIVLYEMLTCRRPFRGDTELSTAVKRLTERAPSPRELLPDLEPRWEHAILRCLERQPGDRFADLSDLVDALAGRREIAPPTRRRRRLRLGFLLGAAATLLLVLAGGLRVASIIEDRAGVGPALTAATLDRPPTLASFDFQNLSGEPMVEWLSTALPEMINMEVAQTSKINPIPAGDVDRVATRLGLVGDSDFDRDTVTQVRGRLGASFVLEGSYLAHLDQDPIRLHLRLHTDGPPLRFVVNGRRDQLGSLVAMVNERIHNDLDLAPASPRGNADQVEGDRLLRVARDDLRSLAFHRARQVFEQVVALEPDHALARALLARTLDVATVGPLAGAQAKLAVELAAAQSREIQIEVGAHAAHVRGDFRREAESMAALALLFPDRTDYLAWWVEALTLSGDPARALEVLEERPSVDATPDLQLLLAEARATGAAGRPATQLELATRALDEARSRGAAVAAASAELEQSRALGALDRAGEALEPALSAQLAFERHQLARGELDCLEQRARLQQRLGRTQDAAELRRQAEDLATAQRSQIEPIEPIEPIAPAPSGSSESLN